MGAKEISRKFLPAHGAVVVTVRDDFGTLSVHTVHISHDHELCPGCGQRLVRDERGDVNVEAEIAAIVAETSARSEKLLAKFKKAGWAPAKAATK